LQTLPQKYLIRAGLTLLSEKLPPMLFEDIVKDTLEIDSIISDDKLNESSDL
jgi:hypothetical protein